jgi:hypothetical protein
MSYSKELWIAMQPDSDDDADDQQQRWATQQAHRPARRQPRRHRINEDKQFERWLARQQQRSPERRAA